jgi:hypothetical protein
LQSQHASGFFEHRDFPVFFGVAEALIDNRSKLAPVEELREWAAWEVVECEELVGWKYWLLVASHWIAIRGECKACERASRRDGERGGT